MEKKTVLVTAIGSFSAASVIGSCKKEGYRVVGCDIYPAEWVASSLEVDRFYQAPLAADAELYLEFLERVCREEGIDFLIPLTDAEIDVLNGWRAAAGKLGVVVCLSPEKTIGVCRDKWAAARRLAEARVCRTIPTRRLTEVLAEEADTGYELLDYPLILKPVHGRSSQGLRIVQDAGQMRLEMERLRLLTDFYLMQPKIEGYVVTVDVVRGTIRDGQSADRVVCLPRRELLRTGNGAGTSVYVFRDARLEKQCAAAARVLDIRGCVNFEFVEEGDGIWYFLECNPRFSGGVAFSCMAGYDMAVNHLRCFAGEPIAPLGEIRNQYLVKRYAEYCTKVE